jgi:DNA repair exonuclease SbcCD ATPase subunit
MLITALTITDYKRVRKVAIKPDADRSLILLGGRNRQGKSSTLDALTAAFGGAKAIAADPVRHGAEQATILVELDGGKLTIARVIRPDGSTTLEVSGGDGALRRPQEVLDKLIGARFLDPLAFLRLKPADQRAQLMRVIPGAERIENLNGERERAFDRRTEVGRDLSRARGELERLPDVEVGMPIDVTALTEDMRRLGEQQRAGDATAAAVQRLEGQLARDERDAQAAHDRVARLQRELEQAQERVLELDRAAADRAAELESARRKMTAAAQAWKESGFRRVDLDAQLARAAAHNRGVYAAEAQRTRRAETAATVDRLDGEVRAATDAITEIDRRKAELLAAAKLPVDGLEIRDDGIALAGVPFGQASASEQLRVALALAIAGSPALQDVWIRDGALFDDDAIEEIAKLAAAAGKRVWVERVGTRDPGVIVIQDGEVAP